MVSINVSLTLSFFCFIASVVSRPQIGIQRAVYPKDEAPAPYDFQYAVDNPQTGTYFGQNEASDPSGRVAGAYFVLLPDGRLMNVDYTVDGESGFVPRITFSNQGAPAVRKVG